MTSTTTTQTIFPVLSYRDPQQAVDRLVSQFGFEVVALHRNEAGVIYHGELQKDGACVMIAALRDADAENPWADATHGTYVYVEAIDAHYERAKAAGAEIVMDIRDMDYGSREYSARDGEGQLWSFGTYRPAL